MYGIGPMGAAIIVGHSGDIRRFPTGGHYARYNGTAPLEASSGPRARHRLNPRGNRQLNHAIHTAALTQIAHDHPGRAYFERKQAEGKTKKEALALSSAASATSSTASSSPTLATDSRVGEHDCLGDDRPLRWVREDNVGTTLESSVTGLAPRNSRLFG